MVSIVPGVICPLRQPQTRHGGIVVIEPVTHLFWSRYDLRNNGLDTARSRVVCDTGRDADFVEADEMTYDQWEQLDMSEQAVDLNFGSDVSISLRELRRISRMAWDSGYSEGYAKAVKNFLTNQNRSVFYDAEKTL